jgi:hypothetical protein
MGGNESTSNDVKIEIVREGQKYGGTRKDPDIT